MWTAPGCLRLNRIGVPAATADSDTDGKTGRTVCGDFEYDQAFVMVRHLSFAVTGENVRRIAAGAEIQTVNRHDPAAIADDASCVNQRRLQAREGLFGDGCRCRNG